MIRLLASLLVVLALALPARAVEIPDDPAPKQEPAVQNPEPGKPLDGISVKFELKFPKDKQDNVVTDLVPGQILKATLTFTNHTDEPRQLGVGLKAKGFWPVFAVEAEGPSPNVRPSPGKTGGPLEFVSTEVPAKGTWEHNFNIHIQVVKDRKPLAIPPKDSAYDIEWSFQKTGETTLKLRTQQVSSDKRSPMNFEGTEKLKSKVWTGPALSNPVKFTVKEN
jgi:hypothetical protein